MTTISIAAPVKAKRKLIGIVLSVPVQLAIFVALCSMTVWTVYFNTYPPIHDATHALRHHTLGVPCH